MAVREARWDCQYCGTTGILGRHKACSNCGRSRPEGTKFYLADDTPEVSEAKLIEQAKLGSDWICEFCASSNPADVNVCQSCNAPREASSPKQVVKEYAPGEVPRTGDMAEPPPPARPTAEKTAKNRALIPILGVLGGLLLLCLCVFGAFAIFGGSNAEATVTGFSWERAIAVEAFQTVTEEDWEVPAGGRILEQRSEIHHYDQVLDHYETRQRQVSEQVQVGVRTYVCGQRDLGNGFFEDVECTEPVYETQSRTETYEEPVYREEPVYQTKYTFEIDKWIVVRIEREAGNDHSAIWPETNLTSDQRAGEQTAVYTVYFQDSEGNNYSLEVSEDEWLAFERGQQVTLELDAFGNLDEVRP